MSTRFPLTPLALLISVTLFLTLSCSRSAPTAPTVDADAEGLPATYGASLTSGTADLSREAAPSRGRAVEIPAYAPDEVLVVLSEDVLPRDENGQVRPGIGAQALSILAEHGLGLKEMLDAGFATVYRLKITDGTSVPDKVAELGSLAIVERAEPNITFKFCDIPYTPNDPFWENPNDFDEDPRTTVFEQFGPSKIGASAAWADSVVGQDVVVCVMDSGIQVWHQDLQNQMWINEDEIPDNGIDDDGNLYIDDIYGWDMIENDNDITEYTGDEYYHGTACAGVVAAERDNALGCSGVAPGAKIMGIRIGFGYSFLSEILVGAKYARDNGADIISMSFSTDTYSSLLESSMDAAWDDGLVLAASAGNDGTQDPNWPAAFDSVVCVGGTSPFGNRWSYKPIDEIRISKAAGFDWGSNYGPLLEVMAFGENYITTHGGNDHKYWDGVNDNFFRGTSNSCPMVAGSFALLKSMHPTQTNVWLRERLIHTSDDLDVPGYDSETGWGRVNVVRACYGPDRYESEEDALGFVDLAAHENQVIDSIHAVSPPYTDTEDLYKFTATQDGYLNFFLDIWTWGETLDLRLYSSPTLNPSTQIDISAGENHATNSHEVVGTECRAGQTFYVKVTPGDYGDSSSYTLTAAYVDPMLDLEIETYDIGFIHISRSNILLGHLDFSSSLRTHITKLIMNVSGTMPGAKLTGLRLYKDSYVNGTFDGLDQRVGVATLNGTNRAIFSNLYEEITASTGPVRYFLQADITGVSEDATFELVLSSYKDVETSEGIEIAYDRFLYAFGPYEVGVDIEPPTWDGAVGVQVTLPRYRAAALFWNSASDPRTPPVDFNVYWTTELPFAFSTAQCEADVGFWGGGNYDHRWVIPDLENFQEYYVAVRAIDQAGNEEDNTVYMSVIPDDTPDPTWPQEVGSFDCDGNNAREVKADPAHQRVFVADEYLGLQIIDVSDPTEPSLIDTLAASAAKGVDYDGVYAYVAYASGMMIVDPDASDGPETISTVDFADALRVLVTGNWAYVTKNGTELLPVDVSDPENPIPYAIVTSGSRGYALYREGNYLYVATFDHPRIFDLTDPSAPVQVANFANTEGHDILPVGNTLYTAFWSGTVTQAHDITDPTAPVYLGQWKSDSGYYGSTVVMSQGYLYFGTQSWGIEVLDVTNPASMVEVGQIQTRGPDGMDTDGVFIYSAENEHGLKVIL